MFAVYSWKMSAQGVTEIPNNCMICQKKQQSLLKDLSYAELEQLEKARTVIRHKKGEVIFKEGGTTSGLLCLSEGKVKIVSEENGREQIVSLCRPVDFINIRALMSNSTYKHSALALENSFLCHIAKDAFLDVISRNSNLSMKLIQKFASELDEADKHFLSMTQKHLRARLADALLKLLDFYGTLSDGKTLNCPLKRSDLAGLSNMNTANVIRTLSAFSKEKIISLDKKKISLNDIEALKQIRNH
jgi:CRP-like cAMP-binding protein